MKILSLAGLMLFAMAAQASNLVTYEVPVPEELKPYSKFYLTTLKVKKNSADVAIGYTLPLAITGVPNQIKFEGSIHDDGTIRLRGKNGGMSCQLESAFWVCSAGYHGIEQDLAAVEALLDRMKLSPEEKAARMEVARLVVRMAENSPGFGRFARAAARGGDMEGVLRFPSSLLR